MARINLTITKHNHSLTIKAGSYIETLDITYLEPNEIYDKVRWIVITAGLNMSPDSIVTLLKSKDINVKRERE